ncbi:Gag-Pol polyprotein [Gossypium australe]|uniref:Gag-Pol polyprotein n=1 Tax=Gossypium australe TaxID=47621 RepID=A0A5B6VNH5_9ROSI|nr:Gag-Pol polyprotein [Gossypium australe]
MPRIRFWLQTRLRGVTFIGIRAMDFDPDRIATDDAVSNAPATAQGTAPADSRPETLAPPPPPIPQPSPTVPQVVEVVSRERPPVDKIRKQGAEEFRASKDDDRERAKFWLENTIRVFDELSCTSERFSLSMVENPCVGGTKGES